MLIIDEEQHFGVAHKEKLKKLKSNVHVLTLTATPIPRTLQLAMSGIQGLSLIATPPVDRLAVRTFVLPMDDLVIREALLREHYRGGQSFYVCPRISDLKEVLEFLKETVRVVVGHGQMDGKVLERNMMDFIEGKFDVLIATTIIESGIDISNANTIIINDAQNFGLSDLHQLRGRVGRSNKKAFCYLIAPKVSMTSEARKRLEALVQFSDLGAGFNIAMKDLDIRGAGNMLGGEQSGFIADIGFEMYQKILNEAIDELREGEFKELFEERNSDQLTSFVKDCILETDLEVRIPDDYVNSVAERLSLYQQMDNVKNEAALIVFVNQLIDRFGPIPKPVEELILSFKLRWLAEEIGVEKLVLKSNKMIGYFIANSQSKFYDSPSFTKVLDFMQKHPMEVKLSEKNDRLRIIYSDVKTLTDAYSRLERVLKLN